MLIEAAGKNIAWSEPRDLTFDGAVQLLTEPRARELVHDSYNCSGLVGMLTKPERGVNVAFASGKVRLLVPPLPKELAIALLTRNGREEIDSFELDQYLAPEWDYGKILAIVLFTLLAVAPKFRELVRRKLDAA